MVCIHPSLFIIIPAQTQLLFKVTAISTRAAEFRDKTTATFGVLDVALRDAVAVTGSGELAAIARTCADFDALTRNMERLSVAAQATSTADLADVGGQARRLCGDVSAIKVSSLLFFFGGE